MRVNLRQAERFVYTMDDAWELPVRGRIVKVPAEVYEAYCEAVVRFEEFQSLMANLNHPDD